MNWRKIILSAFAAFLMLCLTACGGAKQVTKNGFWFDTYVTMTVYGSEETIEKAVGICEHYDLLLDRFDERSDIFKINNAHGASVTVDKDTAEIIALGLYYSELSDGIFDITCGAETSLWNFNDENAIIPDEQTRNNAVKLVDYTQVKIDGCSVTVPDGVQLDLGGIAKGYVADKIVEMLKENGVSNALLSLGGNIYSMGSKSGENWRIGIKSPDGGFAGVYAPDKDISVVTSGDYERYFIRDGIRYHHILDLKNAMPAQTDVRSVTILSPSSAKCDALSTICFVLGSERATELIKSMDDTEAIFILADGSMIQTRNVLK